MWAKTIRYWHTLKYLKFKQVFYRVYYRFVKARPDTSMAPAMRQESGRWVKPIEGTVSITGPDEFFFLGKSGTLSKIGWNGSQRERLWRYNQHYFADLTATNANQRRDIHREILNSWIEENQPGVGTGWEPYPCSLRIVNWIKYALNGNELDEDTKHSLAIQVRWLVKKLEWHILGNHLFANAKALIFAGLWFDGPEANLWLKTGLKILETEFSEQILPDGGQFELSSMYHVLALEDVLDLINISNNFKNSLSCDQVEITTEWEKKIPGMQHWLKTMCHPDGQISLFNDAALDIAPAPDIVHEYARRLGFPEVKKTERLVWLHDSGYVRLENGDAVVIADMGRVGPDYLPGHAHADTLSFEFSLFGERLVTNSGTSTYEIGPERHRQRSSAAHSTLVLDEENSSEVWAGFRVARRARIAEVTMEQHDGKLLAQATHDGYHRLLGSPLHQRLWELSPGQLKIVDTVHGKKKHEAKIYFHLTPQWVPQMNENGTITIRKKDEAHNILVEFGKDTNVNIQPTSWHARFGTSQPSLCICVEKSGAHAFTHETRFTWDMS